MPVMMPIGVDLAKFTNGQCGKILCYFNAACTQWKGRNYIACRCECIPFWSSSRVCIGHMSDQWEPIPPEGKALLLPAYQGYAMAEDPRFVVTEKNLLIAYASKDRQRLAWLHDDMTVAETTDFSATNFELTKRERNWAFFEHDGQLYCIYMQAPHTVLLVKGRNVTKIHEEPWTLPCAYGTPRGGASPVLHNQMFWHFFHSVNDYHTQEPDVGWDRTRRYHIGVAVFESKPPFKLITGSKIPIVSAGQAPNREDVGRLVPSPHAAVFPGSAMRNRDGNGWLLTCGVNDQDNYMYNVPDEDLSATLA